MGPIRAATPSAVADRGRHTPRAATAANVRVDEAGYAAAAAHGGVRRSELDLVPLGADLTKAACAIVRQRMGRIKGAGVQPDAARA